MSNLDLINELSEVENIFDKYFLKGTFTNNYILAQEYEDLINRKLLYMHISGNNAYLLYDKIYFYRVYYFINDLTITDFPLTDKNIVIEILYRGQSNFPEDVVNYWIKNNLKIHLTRDLYFLKPSDFVNQFDSKNYINIHIKVANTLEESQFAHSLISKYIDKYTGDHLNLNQIENYRKEGYLFCAYLNDHLCGILQGEFKNNVWWLGHLVVDEKYRGLKVSNALMDCYIKKGLELRCNSYQLWVIQNNYPAVNLYKKYGFQGFNRSTISLIN